MAHNTDWLPTTREGQLAMAKDRELAALEAALEAAEGEMEEALAGAGSGGRVRL